MPGRQKCDGVLVLRREWALVLFSHSFFPEARYPDGSRPRYRIVRFEK